MLLLLGSGALLFMHDALVAHGQAVNPNCSLIVPENPLTATGLSTPYQLVATDPNQGPCHEVNPMQAAFVQGAVIDPASGQISVYNPLVTDRGVKPPIWPVKPKLPNGAIVALWFGFNGGTLTLRASTTSSSNSPEQGKCVNGLGDSLFGQFAYCNAPTFFAAANRAIERGKLSVPKLGRGRDKITCPTVRDFSVVDQDQSDNVTSNYLVLPNGQTVQNTAANRAQLMPGRVRTTNPNVTVNGSDNRLLAVALDGALGCKPYMAPDLADKGAMTTALPLNELQAAVWQGQQAPPAALVPAGDPMVQVNGNLNLQKLNLYRAGVNQPTVNSLDQAKTSDYCKHLINIAPPRLLIDAPLTKKAPSPDAAVANSLFTFLATRFNATWGAGGLNCAAIVKLKSPIKLMVNANGVTTSASINGITP